MDQNQPMTNDKRYMSLPANTIKVDQSLLTDQTGNTIDLKHIRYLQAFFIHKKITLAGLACLCFLSYETLQDV